MGFISVTVGIFFLGHVCMLICATTTKEAIRGGAPGSSGWGGAGSDLGTLCCGPCHPRYAIDHAIVDKETPTTSRTSARVRTGSQAGTEEGSGEGALRERAEYEAGGRPRDTGGGGGDLEMGWIGGSGQGGGGGVMAAMGGNLNHNLVSAPP